MEQNMDGNRCPVCNKYFEKKYNLKRHLKVMPCQKLKEITTTTVECPACHQPFSRKDAMQRHLKKYHPSHIEEDHKKPVDCPVCPVTFTRKDAMKIHLKKFHPTFHPKISESDDRYQCPVCERTYSDKNNMMRHLRKKHPERAPVKRPFRLSDIIDLECCGQRFRGGRALHRHRANAHFQRLKEESKKSSHNLENNQTSPPANFDEVPKKHRKLELQCDKCAKTFSSHLILLRHQLEDHDNGQSTRTSKDFSSSTTETIDNNDPYSSNSEENSDEEFVDMNLDHLLEQPQLLFHRVGEVLVDKSGFNNFKTTRHKWSFHLSKKAIKWCLNGFSMEVLSAVIGELFKKIAKQKGRIQIKLFSEQLDYPIVMPLFKIQLFNPTFLLNYIGNVLSSKDRLAMDGTLTIEVVHVAEMEGGVRLNPLTISGFLNRRCGVWDPNTIGKDYRCLTFCLAASVLIEKFKTEGKNFKKSKFYKDPFNSRDINSMLIQISSEVEVNMVQKCGTEELDKFQSIFNQEKYGCRQIIVHDWGQRYQKLYAGNPTRTRNDQIHLLFHDDHYSLIWNFQDFIGKCRRYCDLCTTVYDAKKVHSCEKECPRCLSIQCPALEQVNCNTIIQCDSCGIVFRNHECYEAHITQKVCMERRRSCKECLGIIKENRDHTCDQTSKCSHCYEDVDPSIHLCEVQVPSDNITLGPKVFNVIHFDVETATDPENGHLRPYLICCAVNCEKCINDEKDHCDTCGQRYRFWYAWDCVEQFGYWLSTMDRIEKHRTILTAHNSAKFDGYFIYRYAAEHGQTPTLHFQSNTLLSLVWKRIQLKDSLQFLKCSLDKLPSILNIKGSKGFFAWRLVNKCLDTLEYQGKIPPPYDFGIECMTDQKKDKFWLWYQPLETDPNYVYNLKEEAIKYCMKDVKILESAWRVFRISCLKLTDDQLDPLIGHYFTLAAFSAAIYKKIFMFHSIGIIPWGGYRNPKRRGQSLLGSAYLEYLNHRRAERGQQPLISAINSSKEVTIGPYKVDAMDPDTGEVLEILGCYWHAHCYSPDDCNWKLKDVIHPTMKPLTFGDVNRQTYFKLKRLKETGRKVTVIWECEIEMQKMTDPGLNRFFQQDHIQRKYHKPLDPKDAVFGGRVEVFKNRLILTEEQIKAGWTIEYIDFCSQYPYVQWAFPFTLEPHPKVIVDRNRLDRLAHHKPGLFKFLSEKFGLCYCKVQPPHKLRYAVLPYHARNKTVFCLCRTCAEEDASKFCTHSNDERAFEGVYTFYELKFALERGYEIECIFEIWDYGKEMDKIFEQYVSKMISMKMRHSEVPEGMTAQQFCDLWNSRVPGLEIKVEDLDANAAMRLTSKILLNSLWGKFCEKGSKSFTTLVSDWIDLKHYLDDREILVTGVEPISNKSLVLSYRKKDHFVTETSMYNPTIGAYVTAYARMTLLKHCLEVVGDRALYTDTDSLVYLHIPGEPEPPRGEVLGQLANELKSDEYGVCFQCYAPKSWRLEVNRHGQEGSRVIIKTKGLHLNGFGSSLSEAINQRSLWDDLIDMRLVKENIPTDSVTKFYDYLEKTVQSEIPEELIQPCLQAFLQQYTHFGPTSQMKITNPRSDNDAPGLVVPQPSLVRNRLTGLLYDSKFKKKVARFRFDKGLLLNTGAVWPANRDATLPYGYKDIENDQFH